jgi:ATP-binding protein involved in chromosome partitioning
MPERQPIPGVKNLVAVASGKGGVGKTTVAVNLALALVKLGHKVGLIDADMRPNVPIMLGTNQPLPPLIVTSSRSMFPA